MSCCHAQPSTWSPNFISRHARCGVVAASLHLFAGHSGPLPCQGKAGQWQGGDQSCRTVVVTLFRAIEVLHSTLQPNNFMGTPGLCGFELLRG